MLLIWTGGKAEIVQEALGPAFERLDQIPEHAVVPFDEDVLLEAEPGDVVLAMGAKTLKVLQKNKICHGGRSVNSLRQHPQAGPKGGLYLTTLDPFMVRTQADAPSLIRQDVALACRLALTGSVAPKLGDYRIVEDFSDMVVAVNDKIEQQGYCELAADLETLGLHPEAEGARVITIQFTVDPGKADVLFVPEDGKLDEFNHDAVEWLLTNPDILLEGANWKFDSRWIRRHWGINCTNLSRDTLIMGSMVDENRSNSLKTHAWEYTQMGGYDQLEAMGYDKGRMDLVPPEVLVDYAGADTDVTHQSAAKIKKEMAQSPALVRLYRKVVLPAAKAFDLMEHEGVCVDLDQFAKLRHELSEEIDTLEQTMLDLMPGRLKAKYADKIKDQIDDGKSPLVPSLIRDYFFTPYGLNLKPIMLTGKTEQASTAKAHLMMFAEKPEAKAFVEALEGHGSASKTRSTFVDGFLKHLRADGRLHPSYMLFVGTMFDDDDEDAGATTGRTSCKEPAFQTIPKKTKWAKKLRACYPAPPGHLIFAADFSQGELKVVACVAEEENMLNAFRQGLDMHCLTGAEFMGLSYEAFRALEETDLYTYTLMRTGAKAGNFGLLYGMQAPGFREYARVNYNFPMTMEEAEERRHKFLYELYPGLPRYHESAEAFVKKHGYIESPLGRQRHLPLINSPDGKSRSDAVRQAINAPIQSTLNDLTFYALSRMTEAVPELRWFGMVHDQILAYVPENKAEAAAKAGLEIMDNLPIKKELGWDHAIPFTADGELGPRLSMLAKI